MRGVGDLVWMIAPGRWNAVRWFIRRRVRFSTYLFYIAPWLGWPKAVASVSPDSEPTELGAVWGDQKAPE